MVQVKRVLQDIVRLSANGDFVNGLLGGLTELRTLVVGGNPELPRLPSLEILPLLQAVTLEGPFVEATLRDLIKVRSLQRIVLVGHNGPGLLVDEILQPRREIGLPPLSIDYLSGDSINYDIFMGLWDR